MKVQTIVDVPALIAKAGGVMALASIGGVARTTVITWRDKGFLPGNRVAQISTALKLPSTDILKLVPPPKPRAKRTVSSPDPAPAALVSTPAENNLPVPSRRRKVAA